MIKYFRFMKGLGLNEIFHLPIGLWIKPMRQVATSVKQNAVTNMKAESSENDDLKEYETSSHVKAELQKKLPKREPFVKNLYIGKKYYCRFDKKMLVYPEVLNRDRHEMLYDMLVPIEQFFKEKVDSQKIDREARIEPEVLDGLKKLGLYGLAIPEMYGGLGLNATEFSRIMEILSLDGSIAVTLSAHQAIGLKGIVTDGSEAQKQKYLPRLASGELTAAFCLTEHSSGSDAASIRTSARLSEDGSHYLLNGSKLWISNGGIADVMTVFAQLENNRTVDGITAFIVERSFGGVTSGKPEDKMGIRGSNTTEVHFEETAVPVENVLGEVGNGFKVALNILNSGRFSMGSGCAGVLKDLLKSVVNHAVNRKQFGYPLSDFSLIREKLASIAINIYAMESMTYLTAGMLDIYEKQDCSLEAAIVKVFSSEKIWIHASDCLQILGGMGYMKSERYERILRDCRISSIFEGTNEILRLLIGLSCLQFAGKHGYEIIKKLRNPFMNPKFAFKTMASRMFRRNETKLDLLLYECVHPSLRPCADRLEECVKKMPIAVEAVLTKEGAKISSPHNQLLVKRLADMTIDLYAMTAVIGRASRSYCIGIHNNDHEVLIAGYFCHEAKERFDKNYEETLGAFLDDKDVVLDQICQSILNKKGYAAEHPLTRVFW